jgi:integrase
VCDLLTEESKNLIATESKTVAGEESRTQQEARGKIVEFAWKLKREGISESTISHYTRLLRQLHDKGANLSAPDTVKDVIASQESWSNNSKSLVCAAYQKFALLNGISWTPPRYRITRKIPFIPLESEIDQLIASCGKKTSTTLQLLKETGMRIGESVRLKWTDIDSEHNTIALNDTEKNGKPRLFKISTRLAGMLNNLPKNKERVFGRSSIAAAESCLCYQRKETAARLQNPRLLQITFHTLRHWKATMEYHKTKDILRVKELLGHRSLNNTLIYTQLIDCESDDYHSATAKTVEEAKQLVETGFEYVCDVEDVKLFRKRK